MDLCALLMGRRMSPNELIINKTLLAVLITLYPLVDLLRVFILRIAKGHSPFKPDQNHIHHILLKKYDSPLKALIIIQLINLLFILILIL